VIFHLHHYYGGPPINAMNKMWRMLEFCKFFSDEIFKIRLIFFLPAGKGIVTIPKKYRIKLHLPLAEFRESE